MSRKTLYTDKEKPGVKSTCCKKQFPPECRRDYRDPPGCPREEPDTHPNSQEQGTGNNKIKIRGNETDPAKKFVNPCIVQKFVNPCVIQNVQIRVISKKFVIRSKEVQILGKLNSTRQRTNYSIQKAEIVPHGPRKTRHILKK